MATFGWDSVRWQVLDFVDSAKAVGEYVYQTCYGGIDSVDAEEDQVDG